LQINHKRGEKRKQMIKLILLAMVGLLLSFSVPIYAQTQVEDQIRSYQKGLFEEVKQIEKERISLSNENTQIDTIKATYGTAVNVHNDKIAILNADWAPWIAENDKYNVEVNQHNSWKPDTRNQAAVNSYNAARDRFNARREALQVSKAPLQNRSNDLNWSKQQLDNQKIKIQQMMDAYNLKRNEWIVKRDKLKAKLVEYITLTNKCIQLLKDPATRDEAVHLGCGAFFDGSDSTLPTLESLGIKPGEKGWPGMKVTPNK
jgi:chromosome segregation ATPase